MLKQHGYAVAVMMYGFGDDPSPYKESVDLVEVGHAICSPPMSFVSCLASMCCIQPQLHAAIAVAQNLIQT